MTVGRLERRVALVTGAAKGLGAGIATRLAEEGATVLCADVLDPGPAVEALPRGTGSPRHESRPASGVSKVASRRKRLDLPLPLLPVSNSAPPAFREKSSPAKTSRPPRRQLSASPTRSLSVARGLGTSRSPIAAGGQRRTARASISASSRGISLA